MISPPSPPELHPPLQQLHVCQFRPGCNYDDMLDAVTKSASRRAEIKLMDAFVIAFEYIKKVRTVLCV